MTLRQTTVLALIGGCALSLVTGCTSPTAPASGSSASTTSSHPEVVEVIGADGSGATTCTGTMLSSTTVLTSAHCVAASNKAAVVANGVTSAVLQAHFYDWQLGKTSDIPTDHDLAILVLKKSIKLAHYARVSTAGFEGAVVQQLRMTSSGVIVSKPLRVALGKPAGHALSLFVPKASADGGGALFQTDASGHVLIAGVMIGLGQSTGAGYAARLSDPNVAVWIHDVVDTKSSTTASSTAGVKSLHILGFEGGDDDDSGDNTGDDQDNDGANGAENNQNDPSNDPGNPSSQTDGANDQASDPGSTPADSTPDSQQTDPAAAPSTPDSNTGTNASAAPTTDIFSSDSAVTNAQGQVPSDMTNVDQQQQATTDQERLTGIQVQIDDEKRQMDVLKSINDTVTPVQQDPTTNAQSR